VCLYSSLNWGFPAGLKQNEDQANIYIYIYMRDDSRRNAGGRGGWVRKFIGCAFGGYGGGTYYGGSLFVCSFGGT
jgi:hypothetical protein